MALAIAALATASLPGDGWHTYANSRFGYQLCYPADLQPEAEAQSGDGRRFHSRDGADVAVYGELGWNDEHHTIAHHARQAEADQRNEGVTITYRANGAGWAVFSGVGRGRIYYSKIVLRGDQFRDLLISYPQAAAGLWNAATAKMSRCFK